MRRRPGLWSTIALARSEGFRMPGTYSQLLLHVVIATKRRRRWITDDVASRLHPYLCGIVRAQGGMVLAVGGVEDHVHLYVRWRTDRTIAELVRQLKSRSTRWLRTLGPALRDFAWQEGYSVFSVSRSQDGTLRRYIATQAEHHVRVDFVEELRALLRAHQVAFDERYLADEDATDMRCGGHDVAAETIDFERDV